MNFINNNSFFYKLVHKLFKHKSNNIFIQFFRYFMVAGIAFIADFALTFLLNEIFKINFYIASRLGNTLGFIINYLFNIFWVFNKRKIKNKFIEFLLYLITFFIGTGVNSIIEYIFINIFNIHKMLAKIISVFFSYIVRFFLRKILLF